VSEKGQASIPKIQKGHTPQSQSGNKQKMGKKSGTPDSQAIATKTPGSQKLSDASPKLSRGNVQTPQSAKAFTKTPVSEKGQVAIPKVHKGRTPQSQPGSEQKMGKMKPLQKSGTPDSQAVAMKTPLSNKSPKSPQQLQSSAGSSQKAKALSQPALKAGPTTAKLHSPNKKLKLHDDESSNGSSTYDSAEEDFEVRLFEIICLASM